MSGWMQREQEDDLVRKAAILEATLDAMDQGISVFDADLNVVVFNRRFLEILDFPAGRFHSGDSFEAFVRFNAERGEYGAGDVEEQVRSRLALARVFEAHTFERTRPDGTVIEIRGTPLSGGGFLTTYTDVTERRRNEKRVLEQALEVARGQLNATLESVSAGIGLFDADDRLVLFNSHYREVYPGLSDVIREGASFEQILRTAAERGIVADAVGRRERWFEERLALHRNPGRPFQQRQVDGRWIQIDERRTVDGGIVAIFTDVSELKRREEDLAKALQDRDALLAEFNTVMDTIEYGVMFLGPDLCARLTNRAFGELWRFPPALLASHPSFRTLLEYVAAQGMYAVPAAQLPAYIERRYEDVRRGDIPPTDLRLSDGRVWEYQCKSLPDGGRMVTYFDITAYRRTEEALKESEQRFKDFTSSSSDWVWEMGPDLRFTFAAERLLSVFNVSPADVVGKTREEVGRGSLDDEAWSRHMDELRAHRPFKNFRYAITSGFGETVWVSTSGLPVFASNGTFRGYRGTSSDVTLEVRRERELREAKERAERALADLSTVMDTIEYGVLFLGPDFRVRLTNRAYREMWQFSDEYLAGTPDVHDLVAFGVAKGVYVVPAAEQQQFVRRRVDAIRRGNIAPTDLQLSDGRVFEFQCRNLPDGGRMSTYFDITGYRHAERALKQAKERAERALADLKQVQTNLVHAEKLALLGQLVAGIAHEIKNPLNFVNNFSTLSIELLDEMRGELDTWIAGLDADRRLDIEALVATLRGNLAKIREHGGRADGIVKSMLAHSREGPGEKRSADINALVEESLGLAYHGARAQDGAFNATLERDLDPGAGQVDMVPQDISRVLLNVFSNAFHATQERLERGGETDYRPALKVSTRRIDRAVEIRVRDNGVGITAPVLKKIFTPFYTTKPAGKGTGLGLSLSYDIIVHQHGGRFEVDTRAGDYAEFIIRLPSPAPADTAAGTRR